ncbi:hypothetical protein CRYUN_Cryun23aG0139000 [Craigia yunnanensis]
MAVSSVWVFNSLKPQSASLIAYPTVHSRFTSSLGYNSFWVKGGFVSSSISVSSWVRAIVRDKGERTEDHPLVGDSVDNVDDKQVIDSWPRLPERDFAGTPYVPVYVMLPCGGSQLGVIDMNIEAHMPQGYYWSGYKRLFQIVRDLGLKLQVVMSFHECGGNVGDDVHIPLPQWVYFDYMRSFRVEFDEFFVNGVISEIEVGLGPCGELCYPSYPAKHGWRYPVITFQPLMQSVSVQCYDKYLMKSLSKAAEIREHSFWAKGPDNTGSYNSTETGFFCDGAFEGTCIAAKISGIHWWYKTASHAAELTPGFYNPANSDGYTPIAEKA